MHLPHQLWGASAVVLGTWEATAITTGRVPTVSRTVWWSLGCRHRWVAQVVVIAYALGFARHLLKPVV